jgi:uncharacterized protein
MYLDLMDVLRLPGTTVEKPIQIAPIKIDDIQVTAPISGVVRAANARQSLLVSGHAHTEVAMECGRCLQEYSQPLDLELEAAAPLSFFRKNLSGHAASGLSEASEIDEEDEPDDETAAIFDAHSVDVLELIRQAIVLQWPIQPLCSDDCAGLPEATRYEPGDDPRWSALQQWQGEGIEPSPLDENAHDESLN